MTTFRDLIITAEVQVETAKRDRETALATIKQTIARAQSEGRAQLTEDETTALANARAKEEKAGRDLTAATATLAELKDSERREAEAMKALSERVEVPHTRAGALPAYDQAARVGQEERTYHKGNARGGGPFLRDVVAAFFSNDVEAQQRLARHMQEERVERGRWLDGQALQTRAVGTGAFAGLTVPQYITEMYAPAVAARRPFADAMTKLPLPPAGMTVNISRITTASGVALQASENSAVQETNMDDTLLTENVQTAAGQQTVSRQALERGAGIEDVVMSDLQRRYATTLDSTIINQATTGLLAVATDVAYTDASPTQVELYPKLLQAASASEAALLGQANPDLVVMHSRRWYWLQAALTSTWPLIQQPQTPTQAAGVNFAELYGNGFRGVLPNGMAAIVDNNMPTNLGAGTNEDSIVIAPRDESYLWEDPDAPQFIRAEQLAAASLGVTLVLYGYFAYTLRRYANSHQEITGTGLITPAF